MTSIENIPIDQSTCSPYEGFVELEELVSCDDELIWKESARWIKLEEDVDECADRWGKPHVPCLTYRSLREVETNLQNGVCLLDLNRDTLPSIWDAIIDEIKTLKKMEDSECLVVKTLLMTRHEHHHQHKSGKRVQNFARRRSRIMPNGQRSRTNVSEDVHNLRERPQLSLEQNMLPSIDSKQDVSEFPANVAVSFSPDPVEGFVEQFDDHNKKSDLRGRLPENSQATTVLVGAHNGLSCTVSAFIRLAKGCELSNLAEVQIPIRFIFILVGPNDDRIDYHEVGRSFATLMADKLFLESAYLAKRQQDLLDSLFSFMGDSLIIPPGDWDRNLLSQTIPILASQTKELALRRRSGGIQSKDKPNERFREGFQENEVCDDPLSRTGKFCGGLIRDVKRRFPFYLSDFKDALDVHCLPTIIFVYFACLAPTIAFGGLLSEKTNAWMGVSEMIFATALSGVLFGLFAGQPLIIIGATGPLLIFEKSIFQLSERFEIEFLPWRAWVGIWVMVICFIIVAVEGCFLIKYFTRFTEEIFALVISIIFIYYAFNYVRHIFDLYPLNADVATTLLVPKNSTNPTKGKSVGNQSTANTALLTTVLMLGTFFVAYTLRKLHHSHFFGPKARRIVSDFGVFIAIVSMVTVGWLTEGVYTQKLSVPDGFSVSSPNRNSWLINPMGEQQHMSAVAISGAFIPAVLVSILIFMEIEFTGIILDKKEHKLKKGVGYNLDLFVLGLLVGLCSVLGLPWMCATPVHTLSHFHALTVLSTNHAPGEHPRLVQVREQRLTNIVIHLLIGFTVLLSPVMRLIPIAVLFGVFLFLGVSSLSHIQLVKRIKLLFIPASHHPVEKFVTNVKTRKMHLFTIVQVCCVCALVALKLTVVAPAFPFLIICMIPLRKLLERFFTSLELEALDTEVEDVYDSDLDEYDSIHFPF
uniref:Anion exchange protein n=1 Tax=Stylophora pistillata TaxID=50429 RepID=A0A0G2SJ98_STYPI|nr:solute carrier family 4 member alpha [Stylophora pistillata]